MHPVKIRSVGKPKGSAPRTAAPSGNVRQTEFTQFDMTWRIKKEVLNPVMIQLAYLMELLGSLHPV